MKVFKSKFLFLIFTVFLFSSALGQTVIDYQAWEPASNPWPCNIFGTPININNTRHQSVIGQPKWHPTEHAIQLQSNMHTSTAAGDEFTLKYTFKQGYRYRITINAKADWANHTNGPILRAYIKHSTGGSTHCNGPGDVPTNQVGYNLKSNAINATASYSNFVFDMEYQNQEYYDLNISSLTVGPTMNYNQLIYIRKITIEETGKVPFTIAVTPDNNINCGPGITKTFTATSDPSLSNITQYIWDLGPNSNSWSHNGSPAVQLITTSTNSLTLTSACGAFQNTVKVSPYVNNVLWGTYSTNLNIVDQSYQIAGDDVVCSSSNPYTISNLPCGVTLNWNPPSPSGLVTYAVNGNAMTITKASNGWVTLSASFNTCGITKTVSKSVRVGSYNSTVFTIYGPQYPGCGDVVTYSTGVQTGVVSYEWSYPSGYNYINNGGNSNSITLQTPWNESVGGDINLYVTDACGVTHSYLYVYSSCNMYAVSPNPASSSIDIRVSDKGKRDLKNKKSITVVRIYDQLGNLKLQRTYGRVMQAKLDISKLPVGNYFVEVGDDNNTERQKITVIR